MYQLNLRPVGTSTGLIIPKELLGKLRVQAGDTIYLTEAPRWQLSADPYNPTLAAQMNMAEDIMRTDRDVVHVLARALSALCEAACGRKAL